MKPALPSVPSLPCPPFVPALPCPRPRRHLFTAALFAALCCASALAPALAPCARAAKLALPPWLAEASLRQAPVTKETAAIILHDELVMSVAANGRMTTTVRQACRIVTRDGRYMAGVAVPYDSSSQKITSFKAWLVKPNGEGKTYTIKNAADTATSMQSVYSEMRQLVLDDRDNAFENCVFAYEYTIDDRGLFAEERWYFQTTHPVALSRLTFVIPKGWSLTARTSNHASIEPVVNGDTRTWELRDLPAIKPEPLSPSYPRFAPCVSVDVVPPPGMKNPPLKTFSNWADVSIYTSGLYVKPSAPDAAVTAKTRELLATAGDGLWNRINALARFAQAINYVDINTNVGRGGGYTPRPAADVLRTGYGVCRDKVGLLLALLKAAGIEACPATAYSGDRYQVTDDWPSPTQFNHVITAIKIDDPAIHSQAIIEHPVLGRLLFFDPTDYYTPLGDIAYDNQGSLVLLLAGDKGGLARLPFTTPQTNHMERAITAEITADGAINGRVTERSTGQAAAQERALNRSTKRKYADVIRDWLNTSIHAAKLGKLDALDEQEQGRFTLTAEFAAPAYAQTMHDKFLIFKPTIVNRRDFTPLTKPDRVYPVVLDPRSYAETADILIPAGYTIDELPQPVEAKTSFGHYKSECTYDEAARRVRYNRSLQMNAAEIPAKDYATVRQFYETMRAAEQAPVVLRRQ